MGLGRHANRRAGGRLVMAIAVHDRQLGGFRVRESKWPSALVMVVSRRLEENDTDHMLYKVEFCSCTCIPPKGISIAHAQTTRSATDGWHNALQRNLENHK